MFVSTPFSQDLCNLCGTIEACGNGYRNLLRSSTPSGGINSLLLKPARALTAGECRLPGLYKNPAKTQSYSLFFLACTAFENFAKQKALRPRFEMQVSIEKKLRKDGFWYWTSGMVFGHFFIMLCSRCIHDHRRSTDVGSGDRIRRPGGGTGIDVLIQGHRGHVPYQPKPMPSCIHRHLHTFYRGFLSTLYPLATWHLVGIQSVA